MGSLVNAILRKISFCNNK